MVDMIKFLVDNIYILNDFEVSVEMNKYTFCEVKDLNKFNEFSENNGGSIYQTSYWAEVKSAWKPSFYMGYDENGNEVLSCLCLERDVKVGKLWYCPDGFVCDLYNEELVTEFCAYIKSEMKKHKICAMVCDPLVVEKINGEARDTSAINSLIKGGFILNKDKNFYIVQPAITINSPLKDFTADAFLKKCEKGVRHGLKAANDGLLYAETYDNVTINEHPEKLDEFFDVMTETADRTEFIQRDKNYYKTIITALNGKAVMDFIYCDQKKRADYCKELSEKKEALTQNLSELESAEKKDKKEIASVKKQLDEIDTTLKRNEKADDELKKVYGENIPQKLCLAVGITSRFGKTAICLYGGTRNVLRNTLRPTHYLNWERICKSIDAGIEIHDLGRITGNPYDENNQLYGLAKYKLSYNGEATEYVGDMYLIANKLQFSLFRTLLPKVKKIKNTILKKHIKEKTVIKSKGE